MKKYFMPLIVLLPILSFFVSIGGIKKVKGEPLTAEQRSKMTAGELADWVREHLKHAEDINIDWEYLKTCNRHFWETGDLDNDGVKEEVGIFSQWKGEGWWSNDIGDVICIFDQDHNIVYGKEIARYSYIEGLSIEDIDGDGFKEVVVSCKFKEPFPDGIIQYVYSWNGNEYVKKKVTSNK